MQEVPYHKTLYFFILVLSELLVVILHLTQKGFCWVEWRRPEGPTGHHLDLCCVTVTVTYLLLNKTVHHTLLERNVILIFAINQFEDST